jgi:hypothetical protein
MYFKEVGNVVFRRNESDILKLTYQSMYFEFR